MTQNTTEPVGGNPGQPQHWPEDPELVYYEGRPTIRADQGTLTFVIVAVLALVAVPVLSLLFAWALPWWVLVLCVLAALAVAAWPMLQTWTIRYRISNYRIDVERGILKRRIDTLELWHVDDISFEQGIIDRLLNVGCIKIESGDRSTPKIDMHGVPRPREIFNSLKQRIITVKRQRGVIKIDGGFGS